MIVVPHMTIREFIARELLIPSLYNTQNATKVLKDGDEVELDGVNGCVTLLKDLN